MQWEWLRNPSSNLVCTVDWMIGQVGYASGILSNGRSS
jgi:hypothetical protein